MKLESIEILEISFFVYIFWFMAVNDVVRSLNTPLNINVVDVL